MLFFGSAVITISILIGLLSLLPSVSAFPAALDSALDSLIGFLIPMNSILPFDTLATVLGLVFAFEIGMLTFKLISFIWEHIPGN